MCYNRRGNVRIECVRSRTAPWEVAELFNRTNDVTTISLFIEAWNAKHDDIVLADGSKSSLGLVDVKLRFDAHKYLKTGAIAAWGGLNQRLNMNSHQTMLISSNERQFQSGIINLDIACALQEFKTEYVIEGLRWLCESIIGGDLIGK